jgi:hypothetical protein
MVSALIVTYNHEPFVAEAIESALMQAVDAEYEIVISEDCSVDGTREIVEAYARDWPDRIRLALSPTNMGGVENFVSAFHRCRGDFIALLDGDDYWASPLKIQKQLHFLEEHPECAMCAHEVIEIYEDERPSAPWVPGGLPEVSKLDDLLLENFIYYSTAMVRRETFDDFPPWVYHFSLSDFPLWVQVAQYGGIGFLHEPLTAYRVHSGGAWSGKDPLFQAEQLVELHERIRADLGEDYQDTMRRTIAKFSGQLACERAEVRPDSMVAVVSGGDHELLKVGRPSVDFSFGDQQPEVIDAVEAISRLEELRAQGAAFFLVPATQRESFESSGSFAEYLWTRYGCCSIDEHSVLFDLRARAERAS